MIQQVLDQMLDKARQAVLSKIQGSFELRDLPMIADMVQAIQILEKFECHYKGSHETDESADEKRFHSELKAAEEYFLLWQKTHNDVYKQIAKEESKHAELLLRKLQEQVGNTEQIAKMRQALTVLTQKLSA